MFDFASDSRAEGDQPGINDKGHVTGDRRNQEVWVTLSETSTVPSLSRV